jgi:hypothetical protein
VTITYTTEEFIRRAVDGVLGGRYRGRAVCSSCLVGLALERLHAGWRRSEVDTAMAKVFTSPGALSLVPIAPCARCRRPAPCLEERAGKPDDGGGDGPVPAWLPCFAVDRDATTALPDSRVC